MGKSLRKNIGLNISIYGSGFRIDGVENIVLSLSSPFVVIEDGEHRVDNDGDGDNDDEASSSVIVTSFDVSRFNNLGCLITSPIVGRNLARTMGRGGEELLDVDVEVHGRRRRTSFIVDGFASSGTFEHLTFSSGGSLVDLSL